MIDILIPITICLIFIPLCYFIWVLRRKQRNHHATPSVHDDFVESKDRERGTPHWKGGRKQKRDPFVDFAAAYIQIHMRSEKRRLAAERHERKRGTPQHNDIVERSNEIS